MTLNFRITGSQAQLRLAWGVAARQWSGSVGPAVRSALMDRAPVGNGPGAGRLRGSIRYEQQSGAGTLRLTYTANTPYAGFVLNGTRPHVIQARNARALRFMSGGQVRFAFRVNHPGTRPNRFPERALAPLMPMVQQRFREIVTDQLRSRS